MTYIMSLLLNGNSFRFYFFIKIFDGKSIKDIESKHNKVFKLNYQRVLKKDNTHIQAMNFFFSILYESCQSLKKNLENNDKICNIFGNYYVLTLINNEDVFSASYIRYKYAII